MWRCITFVAKSKGRSGARYFHKPMSGDNELDIYNKAKRLAETYSSSGAEKVSIATGHAGNTECDEKFSSRLRCRKVA